MPNLQVANTILEQLGGSKFRLMTGARNFTLMANSLSFQLPSNFAKEGVNRVRVDLTDSDTYHVLFTRDRAGEFAHIAEFEGLYAEDLQRVFREVTGLETHL